MRTFCGRFFPALWVVFVTVYLTKGQDAERPAAEDLRQWTVLTEAGERTVRARLLALRQGHVLLQGASGATHSLLLAKLAADDRQTALIERVGSGVVVIHTKNPAMAEQRRARNRRTDQDGRTTDGRSDRRCGCDALICVIRVIRGSLRRFRQSLLVCKMQFPLGPSAKNIDNFLSMFPNGIKPHIVPVFDVGRISNGYPSIVSKYVAGSDLAQRMTRAPVTVAEAASWTATVAGRITSPESDAYNCIAWAAGDSQYWGGRYRPRKLFGQ
jgi:hypothetical protein